MYLLTLSIPSIPKNEYLVLIACEHTICQYCYVMKVCVVYLTCKLRLLRNCWTSMLQKHWYNKEKKLKLYWDTADLHLASTILLGLLTTHHLQLAPFCFHTGCIYVL